MPKKRRLNAEEREEIIQMKNLGADSKKLITAMKEKTGKAVQLKDIHSIVHSQPVVEPEFVDNLEMGSLNQAIDKRILQDDDVRICQLSTTTPTIVWNR